MPIEISITNWDDYNPRKDLKSMPWFRIQSDISSSESLFGLNPECKWLFIFLLSYAAKKITGDFYLEPNYISHYSGVSEKELGKYLKQLETNGLVRIRSDAIENVPKRREEKKREENNAHAFEFDLEALYQKYPRKIGKKKGMAFLQKHIKTSMQYEKISKAIDNYCAHCKKQNTEAQYIKHFSTFLNSWEDFEAMPEEKHVTRSPELGLESLQELRGYGYSDLEIKTRYPELEELIKNGK